MKSDKLKQELKECYIKRESEFKNLKKFLINNHEIVARFNKKSASDLVFKGSNAKEKLYFLLNDCLNAAGGNNLTRNGDTMTLFLEALNKLPSSKQITFENLCKIFDVENDYTGKLLFDKLKSNYTNFKYKKAALFIKQLHYLQQTDERIFISDQKLNIIRPIPFDAVIAFAIKTILKLDEIPSSSQAEIFNDWASETLLEEAYILEDIWFWGYFSSTNKKKKREFEYNIAKVNMNIWDFPANLEKHKEKIELFKEIVEA